MCWPRHQFSRKQGLLSVGKVTIFSSDGIAEEEMNSDTETLADNDENGDDEKDGSDCDDDDDAPNLDPMITRLREICKVTRSSPKQRREFVKLVKLQMSSSKKKRILSDVPTHIETRCMAAKRLLFCCKRYLGLTNFFPKSIFCMPFHSIC